MVSFNQFLLLYIVSIVGGLVVGLLIFGERKKITGDTIITGMKRNWFFILLLAIVPVFMFIENFLHPLLVEIVTKDYTGIIYRFRGDSVEHFQGRLENPLLTYFFIFIYVWIFTFVMYFTPSLFVAQNEKEGMKRYTLAIMLNYIILIPFYLFFPVNTPSQYAGGVKPLLYENPLFGHLVTSIDPLDNCFPSGHISIALSTVLILYYHENFRAYFWFALVSFILITVSVVYLGIHWLADIAAGVAIAAVAIFLTRNQRFMGYLDRIGERIKDSIRN